MAEAKTVLYLENTTANITFKNVLSGKLRSDITEVLKTDPENELNERRLMAIRKMEVKDDDSRLDLLAKCDKHGIDYKSITEIDDDKYLPFLYKFLNVIIDWNETIKRVPDNLKEKLKEISESDINDNWDFWQNQDIEMIESKIVSFRKRINKSK